mmetsp:Transcript_56678/g.66252  ORF Transcript_56678/g.66252 Transcript_56678/m.66252 type:complete len:93 (+) Transcript_56678:347-625(+)
MQCKKSSVQVTSMFAGPNLADWVMTQFYDHNTRQEWNGMEMYTVEAATAFRSIIGLAVWFEKYQKSNKAEIFNSGVLINFGTSKTVDFFLIQ